MDRTERARPRASAAVLGAWLALALALARAGVVLALELAHHGHARLAGLRLASVAVPTVAWAVGIALVAVLARALLDGRRGARPLVVLGLLAASFLFFAGRLQDERSLRIGTETALGWGANLAAAGVGLVLALGLARVPLGGRHGGRALVLPLALLALAPPVLRATFRGLGPTMAVRAVEVDLLAGGWEVLAARPDAAPGPGILAPSREYRAEGAARPALVLPPPARLRRTLEPFEGRRWLAGELGLDHAGRAELAERFPGHALELEVRVDGARVSGARLALDGKPIWVRLTEPVVLRGGAVLELATRLVDADGAEVVPDVALRVGLGGLALERRERLARAQATRERPSLVLVVLDTLRADRTSAYGYARPTTPHLAALAARGTLFEEVHSTASWTWPSTASILTGLYPGEHGVEDAASSFLAESLDTLPEALQRAGFTTAAWSGSPLIVPDKGFGQGFELFDASREGRLRRSDLIVPAALEWLGSLRGERFFLYLHLMEPHAPFVPLREGRRLFAADVPADYDPTRVLAHNWDLMAKGWASDGRRQTEAVVPPEEQRWISDLYDGCVWSADHWLGRVLARLEELGLTEETLVAVTSDHGEELFEHGLVTHSNTVHRELVRVPLVLAGPGVPPGARVAAPLSSVALAPTLARLLGTSLSGVEPLDLFAPDPTRPTLFSTRQGWWNGHAQQPLYGLRRGSEVLHFAPEAAPWGASERPGPGEVRVYDLARDPDEQRDLAAEDPARARALRAELERLLGAMRARTQPSGAVDPGTLERLRGLGYVGEEE
ncbi:MAG TPA: sulfatase [Planctomycetota bacterium]